MPGTSQFAQLFVNSLAVLGGFLAGYLIAAFIANFIDRLAFRRKSPPFLHRSVRLLGGIALAALVAFIVFGHGRGWTLLGGGSDGTSDNDKPGTPQQINTTIEKPPSTNPPPVPAVSNGERIFVTILGGTEVKAERFYVVGEEPTPRSLAEVREILHRKADGASTPPSVEIRFAVNQQLPMDHPAFLRMKKLLREDLRLETIDPPKGR